jgi:hypothetical protein
VRIQRARCKPRPPGCCSRWKRPARTSTRS